MQVSDLFERENKAIAPAYFLERVSRQQKMDVKIQRKPNSLTEFRRVQI